MKTEQLLNCSKKGINPIQIQLNGVKLLKRKFDNRIEPKFDKKLIVKSHFTAHILFCHIMQINIGMID